MRMFEQQAASRSRETAVQGDPTAAEYARARADYVSGGGGTPPPGATPIDDDRDAAE
jgi:hypothetical protein